MLLDIDYRLNKGLIILKIISLLFFLSSCKTKSSVYYEEKSNEAWFKERYKKAYRLILKAIELDPNNDSLYVRAAYCYDNTYFRQHDQEKHDHVVRSLYNKSLALRPWNANALLGRAQYDFDHHRYHLVLAGMDSLLIRDKKNVDAYWFKEMVFSSSGSFSDSAKFFQNLAEGLRNVEYEDKPILYNLTSSKYVFAENWERAKYYELLSLEVDPKQNTNTLAACYYKMGQMDSACYYFKKETCNRYPCSLYKDSIRMVCEGSSR